MVNSMSIICELCGQYSDEKLKHWLLKVIETNKNTYKIIYYHDGCLKEVLTNPEKYDNSILEKTIEIYEFLTERKRKRDNLLKKISEIKLEMKLKEII